MKHLNSLIILCILMILNNATNHSILKGKGLLLVVVVLLLL